MDDLHNGTLWSNYSNDVVGIFFFNIDTFSCWFPHPLFPAHQFWLSSSSFFTVQSVYSLKNYLFMLSLITAETNSDFLLLLGEIANISCMSSTALLDFAPDSSLASSQTVLSIDTLATFYIFWLDRYFYSQSYRSVEKGSIRKRY